MILGFRTRQQIDTYLESLADRAAGPFCDAANRSNRRAAVYMVLAGRHARRFDCEFHRWGQWFELEQNETRAQASRVTTISEAVQACKNVQASSDVPVGCDVGYVAGVPSMLIAFANLEHAKSYLTPMAKHVAGPFCNAANRGNRKANLFLVVGGKLARPYSCELGEWGNWFELPDEEQPHDGESGGLEI